MRGPFQLTREERERIMRSYDVRGVLQTVEEIVSARVAADPGSADLMRALEDIVDNGMSRESIEAAKAAITKAKPTPQIPTQDAIDWGQYQEWHISVWGVKPPEDHRVGLAFLAFRAGKARGSCHQR